MAGIPKVKITFDADFDELKKGIKGGQDDLQGFTGRVEEFGKRAAIAFAVAATAVTAFAIDSVKSAIADEAAQKKLEETILRTTSASAAQVKGVEAYITKTSLAIGITDDELRPAFERLVRSTNDVDEAQKLVNLALDVAAATGKPLAGVTDALAKAYDGNTTALGKLGTGIDNTIIKGGDVDKIFGTLTTTFGGFAAKEANSTEKAFDRIKIAADEVKEQIGTALLPVIKRLTDYILITVVPIFQQFVNGLTGEKGLTTSLTVSEEKALQWGKKIRGLIDTLIKFKEQIAIVAAVLLTLFAVSKISAAVQATITLIGLLIKAYNALKASSIVAGVAAAFAINPLLGVGAVALAAAVLAAAVAISGNGDTQLPTGVPTVTGNYGYTTGSGVSDFADFTPPVSTNMNGNNTDNGNTDNGNNNNIPGITKAADVVASAYAAGSFYDPMSGNTPDADLRYYNPYTGLYQKDPLPYSEIADSAPYNPMSGNTPDAPVINVTVNQGIVGDPEAAARSVVDVLNNSYYRGTNGANALRFG